eukprot:TRINITY_DN24792_c0_g1_i1.p1 TRINITY_DN24792_c0_g1~~TRINITY_DN24792_c0_g1_i1.p1  ORF type:complete len:167 (-),score=2.91 TRINITY_DN24792_c0_g1_i1:283-783(-)
MASTLFSTPTFTSPIQKHPQFTATHLSFQGLRPLKPIDSPFNLTMTGSTRASAKSSNRAAKFGVSAELNTSLVISISTAVSLFLGRFVFFNFQRENVAKQGLPEQNGVTHFEAGDTRAKEYVGLLKSNDPVGFNIVDVLAWGSIGHIVAYYILATSSNGYDPKFFD